MQVSYGRDVWADVPLTGIAIAANTYFSLRVRHAPGAPFYATLTCTYAA
jgi:hypothetical protein